MDGAACITRDLQRFIMSGMAAIAHANEQLEPRCSQQKYHNRNQPHWIAHIR